jgi:hypothetical protein
MKINGRMRKPHFLKSIKISYQELVRLFGIPRNGSRDNRIEAEWIIYFPVSNLYAVIYNWKNGVKYTKNGVDMKDNNLWMIGSEDARVLRLLNPVLNYFKH